MNGCFTMGARGKTRVKALNIASADALPENVKDGTLAIISDTAVRNVWAQNEEPAEPEEGDVWLTCGAKSSAPIVKDYLTIYPTAAKQYQNGAWVGVSCYVRKNDEWIALEIILYRNGDLCVPVTGGWAGATYAAAGVNPESSFNGAPAMELNASQNYDYTKTGAAALFTQKKIPVGGYGKLVATYYKSDNSGRLSIGLSDNQACAEPNLKSTGLFYGAEDAWATAEVDLTNVAAGTEAYIKIYIHAPGNNDAEIVYVTDVYLTN